MAIKELADSALINWDRQNEIGVPWIDDQHREWIARVIKLGGALGKRKSTAEMAQALKFVVEYTKLHFTREEAFMQKIRYPGLESQKKLHKGFKKYIVEVLVGLKVGKAVLPEQLYESMSNWITQHIKEEDRKIGQFVLAQGQTTHGGSGPDAENRDAFAEKLGQLAGLLESELIGEADFSFKKQAMLQKFAARALKDATNDSVANLEKLKTYLDAGLLTEDDMRIAKTALADNIDVAREVARKVGYKAKIVHINNLLETALISRDQFEAHKAEILGRM